MQRVGNLYIPDGDRHFASFGDDLEHYQEAQRLRAFDFVRNWECAVDLGAHVGIFSRHFARHFKQVVAFEPTRETRECLEKNVPENVRIIPFASGDREDTVLFRRHIKNSGGSEMVENRTDIGGFEHYTVKMIPLDSLDLEGVGLVKLDVQGCEPIALKGAEKTLTRCKPVVLIEEKPLGGPTGSVEHIETSRKILLDYGFQEGEKIGADRIYFWN